MISQTFLLGILVFESQTMGIASFTTQALQHGREQTPETTEIEKLSNVDFSVDRRGAIASLLLAGGIIAGPQPSYSKSYSQNARNMERLNSGDASGGSVYDNNPSSESARKRRAMTGCKFESARKAAVVEGNLSEKDCNQRVMGGESEFMLSALRKLDCPTCPFGIASK